MHLSYFIIRFKMRRQLDLDDFEDTITFKFTLEGGDGHQSTGSNTDQFKMKDISIETIIRSSNKEDYGLQIDSHKMYMQTRGEQLQKSPQKQQNDENDDNQNQQQNDGQQSGEVMKKLIKFIRKVSPLMQEQMKQNLPLYQRYGIEGEQKFFKRQSRLVVTLENLEHATQQKLEISDISWNATGVIVAAAYAKPEHEGACNHKSIICLWSLYKRNFKAAKPDIITAPSCINCINFHPKRPSIFACGSYTGQILLYDYSRNQEQLLAKTVVDDYFHRDLISQINWWPFRPPGKPDTNYNILSLGTDGKILLWQVPNHSINEQSSTQRVKMLLKYPIKGFLMLRKKQGAVVPVSGLAMNQSKINRNLFVIGSEGGSILRATLNPINHYVNHESKALLDLQTSVKFKPTVYPFLLNLLPKHLPEIKNYLEKHFVSIKQKQVQSVGQILSSHPQIRSVYPNPITYAYQPMAFPIASISDNKYNLFIVNAYEGYSRVYSQNTKVSIEAIEEGSGWAWINGSHLMGGFLNQDWAVVDWANGTVLWTITVGEGVLWKQCANQVGVVCERTKIKILQLGDKLLGPFNDDKIREVNTKIQQLKVQ